MLNGWLHRQVALGVRLASLLWSLKLIKFGSVGRTLQTGMQRALSLPSRRPKFQNRFLEGLRGDIHNQVEKTNAQWMASDPSSSCIRGPTGLLQARRAQQHCANIFAANEIRSFLEEFCEEYPELSKAYSARCHRSLGCWKGEGVVNCEKCEIHLQSSYRCRSSNAVHGLQIQLFVEIDWHSQGKKEKQFIRKRQPNKSKTKSKTNK